MSCQNFIAFVKIIRILTSGQALCFLPYVCWFCGFSGSHGLVSICDQVCTWAMRTPHSSILAFKFIDLLTTHDLVHNQWVS